MDKNKKEKLIPVVARISQDNKNKIKELAEKQGKTEADIIREGIDKIININMYKSDLDYISNKIKEAINIDLKKFYKSQRKMQAKLLRTEVINTYMNNEICEKVLGDVYNQMFKEILWNARKKANYYINRDEESEKDIDLYNFYDIAGAIGDSKYRNE
ncbi:MAG: hypothetical protein ACI4XD_04115 [Clostridia bacterium]